MFKNKVFWGAFLDGLAAPWSFWGTQPDYQQFVRQSSVEDTFGHVGANISAAMGVVRDERPYAFTSNYPAAAE